MMPNNTSKQNRFNKATPFEKEYQETVVEINRISKKTKGGNQMRFSALVVVGDKKGKVGIGLSKAPDVSSSIRKSFAHAKKRLVSIPRSGNTLPYSVQEKFGAARIILKPAPAGSGIIAGGTVRTILESAGIRDAVGKILGTKNKKTNAYVTMKALETLSRMHQIRKK